MWFLMTILFYSYIEFNVHKLANFKIKIKYLENIEHFLLGDIVVAIEIIETEGPLEFVVNGASRGGADGAQELPGHTKV